MGFIKVLGWVLLGSIGANGFLSSSSYAGTSPTQILQAAEEIFLKGSVDGKKTYIIVGVETAKDKIKDLWDWTTKAEDLQALKDSVYYPSTSDASNGMNGALRQGIKTTKTNWSKILNEPWKTLKGIPHAFEVNLEKGKQAGGIKYGAWATWAVIQGTYYLVIEAPSEFVGYAIGTVLAVPYHLAWQSILVTFHAVQIVAKYVIGSLSAAVLAIYSGISSTTASGAVLIAAGAVAVYRGGRWLFYDGPKSYFHPIQVVKKPGYPAEKMKAVWMAFEQYFSQFPEYEVESHLSEEETTITLRVSKPNTSKKSRFAEISIYPKKGRLKIKAEIRRKYYFPKTDAKKAELLALVETWLQGVDDLVETPMPVFHPEVGSTEDSLEKATLDQAA